MFLIQLPLFLRNGAEFSFKKREERKKAKVSSFGRRERFRFAATLLLPVVRTDERGQNEEREIWRERERRCCGGLESSRRGAESEGAAISGSSGGEEGSTGEVEGTMATDWRPRTCTRSSRQSGPHLPAKTQLPFRHRARIGPVHSPCPYLPPRAATEKVMRPIPPDYITFFASFSFLFFSFRFHSFLSPAPIRSFCQNEGRTKVFLVWAP